MEERKTVSRRGVMRGVAACALALAMPRPAKADLFGDIGVLLAQLEQQLQLVSHAVSTVTNLVRTVEHLGKVVKNSEAILKQAGRGGLTGILNAAQGFVSLGRGITSNLRMINNDAAWWTNKVERIFVGDAPMSARTVAEANAALRDIDRRRIAAVTDKNMNEAYGRLQGSYDALKSSGEAVEESMSATGVVAQMQYGNRQMLHLHTTAVHQDEMLTDLARRNKEELDRMALEREHNRKLVEKSMTGLDRVNTGAGVERAPVLQAIGER